MIKENLKTAEKAKINYYFNLFQAEGGLPIYVREKQNDFLHYLYESILYRDIITRYKISNVSAVKDLVYFLASNAGKEVTFNSLRKQLGIASPSTISDYCTHLENSFLCFFINRFDYSLKKQTHYAKKVYFIDQALAKSIGFRVTADRGRLLENIVFLELKRNKHEIYFHKDKKECDFVIKQGNNIIQVIQVCASLESNETKQREIEGLLDAMQAYGLDEGLILTENLQAIETITVNHKKFTINIVPVWQFLLQQRQEKVPS